MANAVAGGHRIDTPPPTKKINFDGCGVGGNKI